MPSVIFFKANIFSIHSLKILLVSSGDKFICSLLKCYSSRLPGGYHYVKGVLYDLYIIEKYLSSISNENYLQFKELQLHSNIREILDGSDINLRIVKQWIKVLNDFMGEIRSSHGTLGTD